MKPRPIRALRTLLLACCLSAPLASASDADSGTEQKGKAELPVQELTPQTIYRFLLAEIAAGRGQLGLSAQLYLELTRSTRDPRIARRATEIAMYSRNPHSLGEAAQLWSELAPDSEEARRILANIGSSNGNLEQVQLQLARALAQSTDRLPQNLLGLNRALSSIADKSAVLNVVMRLTDPYLEYAEAYAARAQAAMAAEEPMQALGAVDSALQLKPGWEPAIQLKAQILVLTGASTEAVRQLKSELERQPASRSLRLSYARALVSAERLDEAREQFRQLLAEQPQDGELLYAVGLLSAQLQDWEEAESYLTRALDADHPQPDLVRLQLGQLAEQDGKGATARNWFDQVQDPSYRPEAMIRSALSLAREGEIEAALALLKVQDSDEERARRYLFAEAQILREADRADEAYAVLLEALEAEPEDTDLRYETAMLAERDGRHDEMEAHLRQVIEMDPDHAHAYNALGYSLADRNIRLEEAEELIAHALSLLPDDAFILDSMGWVSFRRDDQAAALRYLERAYSIRQDAEIAAHLGEVLWTLGRHEQAREIFRSAREAYPDNPLLQETIDRLQLH